MEPQSEIPDCRIHYAQHDSIVIYHEGVPFEAVFAHLCYRALAIPYITGMENTCADALQDNVAPKIYLFFKPSSQYVEGLFTAGFQHVYVFGSPNSSESTTHQYFTATNMHEVADFKSGFLTGRILDAMATDAFPDYVSQYDTKPGTGQALYDGIMSVNKGLASAIDAMCKSVDAENLYNCAIARGEALTAHRAIIAERRITQILYYRVRGHTFGAVSAPDFTPAMLREGSTRLSLVDTLMFYNVVAVETPTNLQIANTQSDETQDSTNDQVQKFRYEGSLVATGSTWMYHVRAMYGPDRKDSVAAILKSTGTTNIHHVSGVNPYFVASMTAPQFHTIFPIG